MDIEKRPLIIESLVSQIYHLAPAGLKKALSSITRPIVELLSASVKSKPFQMLKNFINAYIAQPLINILNYFCERVVRSMDRLRFWGRPEEEPSSSASSLGDDSDFGYDAELLR